MSTRKFLAPAALGLVLCAASAGAQANSTKLDLAFHIYAGGYHAMTLQAAAEVTPERYRLETKSSTNGMADMLLRFTQIATAAGSVIGGGLRPERFQQTSDGRFAGRMVDIRYGADGPSQLTMNPPAEADDRDAVPSELQEKTLDPLSAAIAAMLHKPDQPCEGSAPVFDGRRRYNLHYRSVGIETLTKDSPDAFAGEALRCQIEFEPIAGFMKKDEDKTRAPKPPTDLWVAKVGGSDKWLPVRLENQSGFGRFIGHLVRASVDDRPAYGKVANR